MDMVALLRFVAYVVGVVLVWIYVSALVALAIIALYAVVLVVVLAKAYRDR